MLSGGNRKREILKKSQTGLPLISIISVTFNGEKYLRKALQSIVSQSYKNFELIVIDGGSTDGTLRIIESFDNYIDYWQSEPDSGIYDAMNKGLALATGEWVGFKNADDWYCDDAFECLARNISERPEVDFWYGNSFSVIQEEPLRLAPFITDHHSLGGNPGIDHRSCFIRLDLHKRNLFDTQFRLAADFELFCRLKKQNIVFGHLGKYISCKRYGGASDGTKILQESFRINVKYFGLWFAIQSRLKGWFAFMKWKLGNQILRFFLGQDRYNKFKARKICGQQNSL
jgi:glycosyltransferase involved in cell wall biosynthesis